MSATKTGSLTRKRSRKSVSENLRPLIGIETEGVDFDNLFEKSCVENLYCQALPTIKRFFENGEEIRCSRPVCGISFDKRNRIETYYDESANLKRIICNYFTLDNEIFPILVKTLHSFTSLNVLKFDYCDLSADSIEALGSFLNNGNSVTEISLAGNPNESQNFHLLIANDSLKIFSLKLCSLNEQGLRNIFDRFADDAVWPKIAHLDLSSNMIFDEGAKYVAKILRCNRTIQSLNLADCKITDRGCIELMKCFQKFTLEHDEIVRRRALRFEYFKALEQRELGENEDSASSLKSASNANLEQLEEKLKTFPFTSESTPSNGEITCCGNSTLISLNLSYNRLTKAAYQMILETLRDQRINFGCERGLSRLGLEGTDFENKCQEDLNSIEQFFLNKSIRSSIASTRSKGSMRRKSKGSSVVSVKSYGENENRIP